MSKLDDFLGLADVSEIRKSIPVRMGDKELEIVVRPIGEQEHNDIQKRCNVISKNKVSFDTGKYNECILQTCIVEPNFNDADFLAKAGCLTAIDFLKRKFPAGVLMDIAVQIQKLSGFDTYEVEIEDAKN